jgi:hypothetical protein
LQTTAFRFVKATDQAARIIKELQDISLQKPDAATLVPRMQHVQISLFSGSEAFLEEFIAQQGLSKLVRLLRFGKWQVQALALDTIPKLYER